MASAGRALTAAPAAEALASWAVGLKPSPEDLALARRSLLDTVAVMVAGLSDPRAPLFERIGSSEAGRWAALAHVLDYDDLHMPSTTHISAVCVPAALSAGGDARAYLAGAGVMARLGSALGWRHYSAGWHATCTAGAPAAAVAASVARGLDPARTAVAIALAVPGAGGVQRAFGTAAKALQVGFAVDAGVRAAALAEAGASADAGVVEQWMGLVGGDACAVELGGPAVADGLAVKLYPCCYALQRPIAAALALGPVAVEAMRSIRVATPACSLAPLIHHRPQTGLEGKFSLEYGLAAALLDGPPGIDSFSDEAVRRAEAARLGERVEVVAGEGGTDLLAGQVELTVGFADGSEARAALDLPPGAPARPLNDEELRAKLERCAGRDADVLAELSWPSAAAYLRSAVTA